MLVRAVAILYWVTTILFGGFEMNQQLKRITAIGVMLMAAFLTACSTTTTRTTDSADQARLKALEEREGRLITREQELNKETAEFSAFSKAQSNGGEMLPPNAQPGECYARMWVPASYRTETETVLRREAGEKIKIIPAQYRTVEKQVLVKEASERLEVIPATYKWVEEKVLVTPAQKKIVEVSAIYESVTERVLAKPAHTVWKTGNGPIQKIDEATGEIMCLVDVPATYKTITKRVLKEPATTNTVDVPAVYKTIKKKVVDRSAYTKTAKVPAHYNTIKVTELVRPAQEKRYAISAEYEPITKHIKVSDGHMEWRSILCETNMTRDRITSIQRALQTKGYDPGEIDGVVGRQTMEAVNAFQRTNNLPVDKYLNVATVQALGVSTK